MCDRSSQSTSSVAETQVSVGAAPAKLISLHCCLPITVFPRYRNGQRIAALQLKARGRDALGEAATPWVDRGHQVEALVLLLFSASSASREAPLDNAISWSRTRQLCYCKQCTQPATEKSVTAATV